MVGLILQLDDIRSSEDAAARAAMRKVLYIFGLLTDTDVAWIAKTGIRRRLQDGDVLIRQGEPADALIFCLEGELVASNRALGQFARMGVGEIVGEVSLVDSAPPSAT